MSTATKKKPAKRLPALADLPPAVEHAPSELRMVDPAVLKPSPLNPRKHIDPAKVHELAVLMRLNGWRGATLARPIAGDLETVYGHCRTEAAKLAGLGVIRVEIAELTDAQVLDMQLAENMARGDLHPLEEAEAFHYRIEKLCGTVEEIAANVDRSPAWVRGRLALRNLIERARDGFLAGKLQLGHAQLLSALAPADQEKALEESGLLEEHLNDWQEDPLSVRQFGQHIRHEILTDLKNAPWELNDAGLVPEAGACSACPKRSGAQPDLFPGVTDDRCADSACFNRKKETFLARQKERAAAKAPDRPVLEVSTAHKSYRDESPKGTKFADEWRPVKAGDECDSTSPAVVVAGYEGVGDVKRACTNRSCKKHWGNQAKPAKNVSPAEKEKRSKEALKQRLDALVRRKTIVAIAEKAVAGGGGLGVEDLRLVARALWQAVWLDYRQAWGALRGAEDHAAAWKKALVEGRSSMDIEQLVVELALCQNHAELKDAAKRHRIDPKEMLRAAKLELVVPSKPPAPKKAKKGGKK